MRKMETKVRWSCLRANKDGRMAYIVSIDAKNDVVTLSANEAGATKSWLENRGSSTPLPIM